ncbi:MAG: phage portal protein [Caulobacteraceae bacterium]|nr:phage portal protein [Caulobacteraceae bacterium]
MPPAGGLRTSLGYRIEGGPLNGQFLSSWGGFSPGVPLAPIAPEPVRVWDFPVGINTVVRPRAYEPFGFAELRAFANVELVRLAIETRKDQVERLRWRIVPHGGLDAGPADPRIAALEAFWRRPDGVTPFATWLRLALEDLLVLDAPAFERRRSLSGALVGLDVIPGDTIHPMVDETGRRPRGPAEVAFQQVIKGVAWANLTNDDLIYAPRNPRPNHNYGFSPVEQIIVTINTVMRRQAAQLAYFTEGNTPAGLLNGPEGWNPDQIRDMQAWLDARLSGQTAEQAKLLWVPAGTRYQSFKDAPIKDDFDEWLARIVAYAFSLPPTPFIRQMNKGTAGEDQDRGLEEGLEPIKHWVKRLIDGVIQDEQGCPDLEFAWNDAAMVDPAAQANIDDVSLRNGSTTIDEVRARRGQAPLPDGQGAKARIYGGQGAVELGAATTPARPSASPPATA